MKFEYIEIPDNMIKDEWWDEIKGRFHYTGHSHFNSPFETDDSCGNCDGAKCHICKKITEDENEQISIEDDIAETEESQDTEIKDESEETEAVSEEIIVDVPETTAQTEDFSNQLFGGEIVAQKSHVRVFVAL